MRVGLRRAFLAVLGAMSLVAAQAGIANALQVDTVNTTINGSSVAFGTLSFSWTSRTRLDNLHFTIQDTGCDGKSVYSYFKVYNHAGSNNPWNTTRKVNNNGCHGNGNTYDSYINDESHLIKIRYYVCRSDNICNFKEYLNPYWQ